MKRYKQTEIKELAAILKNDGVISVPTDTVFGVCARMNSLQAQENLREVKNRPETKAFPVMCSDKEQIKSIAEVDKRAERIIDAFMPGPLTIILKRRDDVPSFVNGGLETLAIRLAPGEAVRQLIEETGSPLFMTSANQSGQPVCKTLDEIEQQCPLLSAMMEGEVSYGEASTIVDCTKDELQVVRKGPITEDQLKNV